MAKRVMSLEAWSAAVAKYDTKPRHALYDEYMGYSPGGAAAELGVGRTHVHALVHEGKLDILHLTDRRGRVVAYIVTDASIKRRKLLRAEQQDLLAGRR